ncbi:ABC transporter substrate-binding protein [Desulfococcaceae bacterium HSG8]|nr:ABC transporter substrate-binding protein [Desulfococcaceae bacterium HSG8]
MKKILLILLPLLFLNIVVYLLFQKTSIFKKESLLIAFAGPLGRDVGRDIVCAIRMLVDKVNNEGGINGKKIELRIYDDENNKAVAKRVASEIAEENEVLLVVGHYYSSTSAVAGEIYRKHEIPVITGSATADSVTRENDWYFRTIPNNSLQASFIANYIYRSLMKQSVSIIYDKDDYGVSLLGGFQKAAEKIGIEVRKVWKLDTDDKKNLDKELKRIADELIAMKDPGMVFIATHSTEGAKLITRLKDSGKPFSIFGPDAFSGQTLLKRLKKYGRKDAPPGYYPSGLYCVTPYMNGIGNERTYRFEQEFFRRYQKKSTWGPVCFYDAILVAVEAMKRVEFQDNIWEDRRRLRDSLMNFYDEKRSVEGLTGYIYFDEKGDINRPYVIGTYDEHERLLPAYSQYQQITNMEKIDNVLQRVLDGGISVIDGKAMRRNRVVHSGIYINKIDKLDVMNSTFTADFYLWFRYTGNFDYQNIRFMNAVNPLRLGKAIIEETENGTTTRVFRLRTDFKAKFDFHSYPFGHLTLPIHFRHNFETWESLIFVQDNSDIPSSASDVPSEQHMKWGRKDMKPISGWKVREVICHQDMLTKISSLGQLDYLNSPHKISYSRFNTKIILEKTELKDVFRTFIPVIAIILVMYVACFIQPDRLGVRIATCTGFMIVNGAFHADFLTHFPVDYLTAIEYAFFAVYVFVIIYASMSVFIYRLYRKGNEGILKFCIWSEKILYPGAVSIFSVLFVYYFTRQP